MPMSLAFSFIFLSLFLSWHHHTVVARVFPNINLSSNSSFLWISTPHSSCGPLVIRELCWDPARESLIRDGHCEPLPSDALTGKIFSFRSRQFGLGDEFLCISRSAWNASGFADITLTDENFELDADFVRSNTQLLSNAANCESQIGAIPSYTSFCVYVPLTSTSINVAIASGATLAAAFIALQCLHKWLMRTFFERATWAVVHSQGEFLEKQFIQWNGMVAFPINAHNLALANDAQLLNRHLIRNPEAFLESMFRLKQFNSASLHQWPILFLPPPHRPSISNRFFQLCRELEINHPIFQFFGRNPLDQHSSFFIILMLIFEAIISLATSVVLVLWINLTPPFYLRELESRIPLSIAITIATILVQEIISFLFSCFKKVPKMTRKWIYESARHRDKCFGIPSFEAHVLQRSKCCAAVGLIFYALISIAGIICVVVFIRSDDIRFVISVWLCSIPVTYLTTIVVIMGKFIVVDFLDKRFELNDYTLEYPYHALLNHLEKRLFSSTLERDEEGVFAVSEQADLDSPLSQLLHVNEKSSSTGINAPSEFVPQLNQNKNDFEGFNGSSHLEMLPLSEEIDRASLSHDVDHESIQSPIHASSVQPFEVASDPNAPGP